MVSMWKNLPCFGQSRRQWRRDVPSRDQPSISQCDQFVQIFGRATEKETKKHTLLLLLARNNRKNLHIFVMLWNEMLSSPAESSKHVVHALRSSFDTLSAVKRAGSLVHSSLSIVFITFACIIYTNFTLFYVFFNAASFAHIFLKDLQHFSTHFHKFSRRKNWKHFLPWLLTGKKEM